VHVEGKVAIAEVFRLLLLLHMLDSVQHIAINDTHYRCVVGILNAAGAEFLPGVPVHHGAGIVSYVVQFVTELLGHSDATFGITGVVAITAA